MISTAHKSSSSPNKAETGAGSPRPIPAPVNAPFMKFKDEEAEQEWERLLQDAHQHDEMVWRAVCFAVEWVFNMEAELEKQDFPDEESFGDMVEWTLTRSGFDLTYKQLVWSLTWIKRCWKWGDRIVSTRLF